MSTEPVRFGNCDRCGMGVTAAVMYENDYGNIVELCGHHGQQHDNALNAQGFHIAAARKVIEVSQ